MENEYLKSKIRLFGFTQKEIAAEMGINYRVFQNKINRRPQPTNGNEATFTVAERFYLAKKLKILETDIL